MTGFLEVFGVKDDAVAGGYNLTTLVQQLISSLMTLGAFVGSLMAGPISSYLNRRWSIFLGSFLCVIAVLVMVLTTKVGVLYFARLLLGIAKYVPGI